VIIASRDARQVHSAVTSLPGEGHTGFSLDVSKPAGWTAILPQLDSAGALHGMVAAAGIVGPIGPLDEVPPDELLETVAVNLFGTILALHHALPRLRMTGGRAVTFSGGGATFPLPRYDGYAASKAAVVRLTENVAAAFAGEVEINAVAPGFVATAIHEATLKAGPERAGVDYHARTLEQLREGGLPAREAAELVCFLLSDESRGITGRLVSAQWDPWRESSFQAQLRTQDGLGTLRRIDGILFGAAAR
jgi:3-oxoacyl-[acyl-carrier protein] reductase